MVWKAAANAVVNSRVVIPTCAASWDSPIIGSGHSSKYSISAARSTAPKLRYKPGVLSLPVANLVVRCRNKVSVNHSADSRAKASSRPATVLICSMTRYVSGSRCRIVGSRSAFSRNLGGNVIWQYSTVLPCASAQ
ncbi:Uncharacterised protein [Mycobacteroides abscessus subsp. massiliense]|nr:Uncharacterised protein [Mycobacteroides abscessus subsp. massiliense]